MYEPEKEESTRAIKHITLDVKGSLFIILTMSRIIISIERLLARDAYFDFQRIAYVVELTS